jgi:uncharacterized membrane protein YkoI
LTARGDSYGQEEETEIFARRRHRSEARDAPLQARKSQERQKGGKGGKVKSRKQAIAIALSKARKKGKKVPRKKK